MEDLSRHQQLIDELGDEELTYQADDGRILKGTVLEAISQCRFLSNKDPGILRRLIEVSLED